MGMRFARILFVGFACVAGRAAAEPSPAEPSANDRSAIIITGERIGRSLKNTSSSVEVFGRDRIDHLGAARVDDLFRVVPNVTPGHGSQGPAIRGQDTTGALGGLPAFLGGNRPRTTVVIDGRRQSYNEFVFGASSLWDVAKVEIFRSPQTTTQGQNSIAGAIFVVTEDPVFDAEARGRLILGNLATRELSAAVSAPLTSDIAVRVAGDFRRTRPSSWIKDTMFGANPNSDSSAFLRTKLLFAPADAPGTRLTTGFTHSVSKAPQIVGIARPFKRRRDPIANYGVFRVEVDALTANLRQELGGGFSASALLSGGRSRAQRFAAPGFGEAVNRGRDWSGEGILTYSNGDAIRAIGGISVNQVKLQQRIDLSVFSGIGRFRDDQRSMGLFGEIEATVLPGLHVTGGLRFQQDTQIRDGALATTQAPIPLSYDRSFRALLPKFSAAYDVTPTFRAGVLVERAFNPGGTTLRFDTGQPDLFNAETLWDYELFLRGSSASGNLHFSANLFRYDMRDAQRSTPIRILAPNGRLVTFADLYNVDRARSEGLEGALDWSVHPLVKLSLGIGVLRTRILDAGMDRPLVDGMEFERSPHFTANAGIEWKPSDRLTLSIDLRHTSGYFSDDREDPALRISPFTTVDARAAWQRGAVSVFAYARNLSDNFYLTYLFNSAAGSAGNPREVGVGIDRRF